MDNGEVIVLDKITKEKKAGKKRKKINDRTLGKTKISFIHPIFFYYLQ